MANAFKCDRCQVLFEGSMHRFLRFMKLNGMLGFVDKRAMQLCESCSDSFERWADPA